MGKSGTGIKKWAKKAWSDVKKDPEVISRTIARADKRISSVLTKGEDAYNKYKRGDILGATKGAFNTYKAAVGAKKHNQLIEKNKYYRRAANVGSKTFKAAEAFQSGDHDSGYKHAMDAARAAIGKAKIEQVKSHKKVQAAIAAIHGFEKAAQSKEPSNIKKLEAGIGGYVEKRKQQKEKSGLAKPTQLLGRNG